MATLPLEILLQISSHVQKPEMRKLRLVCRALARCLIPQIFKTVNFRIWIDCLEGLFQLSQNKHIAPHVKHLNCSPGYRSIEALTSEWDYLLELLKYTQFGGPCTSPPSPLASDTMRTVLPYRTGVWRIKDMTVEQLEAAYTKYRKRPGLQTTSHMSGVYVRGLVEALSGLPNLQSFTLRTPSHKVPWTELLREIDRSTRMGRSIGDAAIPRPTSPPDLDTCYCGTPGVPMSTPDTPTTCGRSTFSLVIRALAQLPQSLREFTAIESRYCLKLEEDFYSLPKCETPLLVKVFGHLRRLHLNPDSPPSVSCGLTFSYYCAPNLEELVLESDRLILPYPVSKDASGRKQSPKLRHVELIGLKLSESQLLDFLLGHSTTLRILHLRNITLVGNWVPTLQLLRSRLQLKEAKLDGFLVDQTLRLYFSSETSPPVFLLDFSKSKVATEDYLVGKSEENPLTSVM